LRRLKVWLGLGVAFLVTGTAPAFAWNGFGHMEIAAVAWQQLSQPAKARAAELLRLNPRYGEWTRDVAAADQAQIAFVIAATWADLIKRDPDYRSDGPHNGDVPPSVAEASQNIGYQDKLRHKYWHFVDMPFSPDNTPLEKPQVPNAQTEIALLREALGARTGVSDDIKSYDLVWLLHLVGDVHQPLHATSRFTHDLPNGDAGGNLVKIRCEGGCPSSAAVLHAFWDDVLGPTTSTPQEAITAAGALEKPPAERAAISDEKLWIQESVEAAKAYVYADSVTGAWAGPMVLSLDYKAQALAVAKARVALAGARLAALINEALQ
jgi:S1/P1 Nuclease